MWLLDISAIAIKEEGTVGGEEEEDGGGGIFGREEEEEFSSSWVFLNLSLYHGWGWLALEGRAETGQKL